jgi:hypothetical protein
VSKKGMICVPPTNVCTRNLRRQTESVLLRETNTFCAWNMGAHVQCTTSQCQRYKKQGKKSDSRIDQKGRDKISK